MTTTIAEPVSRLAETLAAQAGTEVMGAFVGEQADLVAGGAPGGAIDGRRPLARRGAARPRRCGDHPARRAGRPGISPGLLPGRRVPLLQHRAQHLPGGTGPGVGPPGCGSGRGQPAAPRRFAQSPGEEPADLQRALRFRQPDGQSRRDPHGCLGRGARRSTPARDWISPRSTRTAPPGSPCPPRSSSTPTGSSAGSTSTPTTPPAPNPTQILAALDNLALR